MIKMIHHRGRRWSRSGNSWVKGFAYYNDRVYSGNVFAELVANSRAELVDLLPRLRGEYAVAREEPDGSCVLAVDRIRSIPLFYSAETNPAASDDADILASDAAAPQPEDHLKLAFLLQGVTLGNDTLRPEIKQVRAGELVRLSSDGATSAAYFGLGQRANDLAALSEDDLIDCGIAVLESSFGRMLRSLDGPCVVPLSGGLDSRLVAAMLCRLGRKDTLCFSYGDLKSFEAGTSKDVAEHLGLKWEFVDYSRSKWHEWASSPEFQSYSDFASQHCTIEHEQDWPAVRQLSRLGLIADHAIFVPGHSGDFLAGSHLPEAAFANPHEGTATDWVMEKYMTQWPTSAVNGQLLQRLRDAVRSTLPTGHAALQFDDYGWRHRQAMMIVNSVRTYEYHGFDWRLPLWDEEMITFWSSIPIRYRRNKYLYLKILRALLGDLMQIPYLEPKPSMMRRLRDRLTDSGYSRYGIFAGSGWASVVRPMTRALSVKDPIVSAVIRPWRNLPLLRARINGLLAVNRLESVVSIQGRQTP